MNSWQRNVPMSKKFSCLEVQFQSSVLKSSIVFSKVSKKFICPEFNWKMFSCPKVQLSKVQLLRIQLLRVQMSSCHFSSEFSRLWFFFPRDWMKKGGYFLPQNSMRWSSVEAAAAQGFCGLMWKIWRVTNCNGQVTLEPPHDVAMHNKK